MHIFLLFHYFLAQSDFVQLNLKKKKKKLLKIKVIFGTFFKRWGKRFSLLVPYISPAY